MGKCRSEIKRTEPDAILYKAAFGSVLAVFPWGAVHFFTETFSEIGLLAEAGLQDDLSDGKCGFCYLRDFLCFGNILIISADIFILFFRYNKYTCCKKDCKGSLNGQ